ncbi:MAG: dihydropteroate synthase [Haloarculaceae archaeon]
MEYHEAANFLFDLRRYSSRKGTAATRALLDELGAPDEDLTVVQIAGSNGKGSTARMTERLLREAGLDVGLYTSPHLDDVRERVRINGRKLPERAVCEFVERVRPYVTERAAENAAPTFFETITALGVWGFARAEVDVAILEVGIGGRYDATSAVTPDAAAVTEIALEHTEVLGDTVEEIGRDKAHVSPATNPLVTATTGAARAAVAEVAGDLLTVGGEDDDVTVDYRGRDGLEGLVSLSAADWAVDAHLALLGAHQARNAGVAVALARQLADLTDAEMEAGLRKAHWPGRFEVMTRDPLVVLDGAHNPGSCAGLAETLAEFDYDDLHLVVGAMSDKDHAGMADALPAARRVVVCEPDLDRAEDADVLARSFEGHAESTVVRRSVASALETALAEAGENDAVVVTGSLYAVAEARERWARAEVPKRVDSLDDAAAVLSRAHVTDAGVWRMRGKGVHRVVHTRVQERQAQFLKEELLSLGGECAISGIRDPGEENIDVVMMGTLAQFRRLAEKLGRQPYGLAPFAADLRAALDIGTEADTRGYPWEEGTAVMGILNVTPDSFHDGGRYATTDAAVERAEELVAAGADVVDVGGESTRPGAEPVAVDEEKRRVVPVVRAIADLDALVSVDTRRPEVARAALDAGADVLNDVSGLEDPKMAQVAADHDVPIVIMHSIEAPVDPETEVEYDDVVEDVIDALTERVLRAERAGLDRSQIIVDPGLGFGKTRAENFEILGRIDEFEALGCPVLVGHSHKSMFDLVGTESDDRLASTVAGTALAAARGVDIVRVHDAAENADAVDVVAAATDPEGFGN